MEAIKLSESKRRLTHISLFFGLPIILYWVIMLKNYPIIKEASDPGVFVEFVQAMAIPILVLFIFIPIMMIIRRVMKRPLRIGKLLNVYYIWVVIYIAIKITTPLYVSYYYPNI